MLNMIENAFARSAFHFHRIGHQRINQREETSAKPKHSPTYLPVNSIVHVNDLVARAIVSHRIANTVSFIATAGRTQLIVLTARLITRY